MKPSRLFLGFTFVVFAGVLTLLWQAFVAPRPATAPKQDTPPVAMSPANPAPPLRRGEPEEPGMRSVYPGGRSSAAKVPQRADIPPPAQERTATAEPPAVPSAVTPDEAPASTESVDLNTASLEQLNALGAGMVGKTIIANRPYTAPDDLLAKRVLNRRDFETIKPRVTAR